MGGAGGGRELAPVTLIGGAQRSVYALSPELKAMLGFIDALLKSPLKDQAYIAAQENERAALVFRAAQIHFDHGRHDLALPYMLDLMQRSPDSRKAIMAAYLSLGSLAGHSDPVAALAAWSMNVEDRVLMLRCWMSHPSDKVDAAGSALAIARALRGELQDDEAWLGLAVGTATAAASADPAGAAALFGEVWSERNELPGAHQAISEAILRLGERSPEAAQAMCEERSPRRVGASACRKVGRGGGDG